MPLKAIMYHYVRPEDQEFPYFKCLQVEDFVRQLDWFADNIGFAGKSEFLSALRGGPLPDGVVLTFDDGFKDHYEYVLPELKRRGLWGIFYIPTAPLRDGTLLNVHKTHLLLGRFDASDVAARLRQSIHDEMIDGRRWEEFRNSTYLWQQNHDDALYVKRMLNYFVSYKYRSFVLSELMDFFFGTHCGELARSFYMTQEQMKCLRDSGMLLGSHSVSHPVMSRLPIGEQEGEICDSFLALEEFLAPLQPRTFCYPYGGRHTFSKETETLLTRHGVLFSFAVEPAAIDLHHMRRRPQALPRYDCNMFPHGQCRK